MALAEVAQKQARDWAPALERMTRQLSSPIGETLAFGSLPLGCKVFDPVAFRAEAQTTLAELRVSYDIQGAVERLAELAVPWTNQAVATCELLTQATEERADTSRKAAFAAASNLVQRGTWASDTFQKGLQLFLEDICPDLQHDVPMLPQVLKEELHPALVTLVSSGALQPSTRDLLLQNLHWTPIGCPTD